MTHKTPSFLHFHIYCIKVTVIFTGTTLDTQIIVDLMRMLDSSGNRSRRTVLRTFSTADTELGIDMELTQSSTYFCMTLFITDIFNLFVAEKVHGTDDRKRCTLSKTAQSHTLYHVRQFFQLIEI